MEKLTTDTQELVKERETVYNKLVEKSLSACSGERYGQVRCGAVRDAGGSQRMCSPAGVVAVDLCVCVCVCLCACLCVCVFIKLHITTQSGPVILVILCHSH